jgi:hypothetical protein
VGGQITSAGGFGWYTGRPLSRWRYSSPPAVGLAAGPR